MERHRVKLSPQGLDYLNNPNCSSLVRCILSSIDHDSAEVIQEEESIVRVRLLGNSLPEDVLDLSNIAIHKDHIQIY